MAYLGIDVGSLYLSMVLVDGEGTILQTAYLRHQGEPLATLREAVKVFPVSTLRGLVRTGAGGVSLPVGGAYVDAVVSGLEGVRNLVPDARNIISIGGGSFSLTQLDGQGHYLRSTINSACASGTGAFLDQQALRLQVPPTELAHRAMEYTHRPPGVATRCAVFAKSDMIHLQQEGFSVEAIAAGLCAGLGNSTVDGLLGGRALEGKTALIGGVARNTVVAKAVTEKLGVETVVPDNPELACALGAALVARSYDGRGGCALDAIPESGDTRTDTYLRPPLALRLSPYPDFAAHDHWVTEDGSEIAILKPVTGTVRVSLGIDIGSTSTKAAVLDDDREVVGWIYRKTAGNPIRAVQLLFDAFRQMQTRGGFTLDVRGVGTTGSGRKMIGALVGADLATNEITAHAAAATYIDPQVDTIIELGGQDAKFTQLQNGMVYNSVMNYVCAAGTGSFIEEQALKLGIPLTEYADRAMGKECPKTSDRCTVYMERDLDILMAGGWSRDQIAAAVLHSVRDNYLNKVVGGLHIGDHVYFQGATARNKALVAAFEVELQKPIQVSPFCHITGALGMCLQVRDRVPETERSTRFRGFGFADEPVQVEYEVCELCHNLCNLSLIKTGGNTLAWGLKCGRDYGDKKVKARNSGTFEWWRQRDLAWHKKQPRPREGGPRVGVLRSLGTYGYYPYWNAFLSHLGCTPVLSGRSSEEVLQRGNEITSAEYCAPVVMSHGHARTMLEKDQVDYILLPHMIREPLHKGFTESHFCGYVQAHPSVLKSVTGLDWGGKMLAPIVQFCRSGRQQNRALADVLCKPLGVTEADIAGARLAAERAQNEFREEARVQGDKALAWAEANDSLLIVCVGRPYNTTDFGLTLELPRKIAEMGYPVLFMDQIRYDLDTILPEYANMFWHYGQKILATAEYCARHKRVFPIYFTNFMCGPDSYIMTYFLDIMGRVGKPYLCLQFDGHGADAGYLTRIEAALESFHAWAGITRPEEAPRLPATAPEAGVSS